jgi:hypothetical protein
MVPQSLTVRNEQKYHVDEASIYESVTSGKFEFTESKEKYAHLYMIRVYYFYYVYVFIYIIIACDRFVIKYEDLQIGTKIGAGSFGEVKAGILRGKKVAIKQLIRHKVTDIAQIELRAECAVLRYYFLSFCCNN